MTTSSSGVNEKVVLVPELAQAIWAIIEPHTPDGDDGTEGREFVDFVTRVGFGVVATIITSRNGLRWQPARLYHDGLRVRLEADDPLIDLIDELDGQLAALFPSAELGARSRLSALSQQAQVPTK